MRRYKIDPEKTAFYFCTCTVVEWQCVFKEEKYYKTILDSLYYCREHKGLLLYGLVIMLNHIHLIVSSKENILLSDIMRDFKRHTSKQIAEMLENDNEKLLLYVFRKAGEKKKSSIKIWKDEYRPEALYSEKWFHQKLNYLHDNPVRKGFVLSPEDWKYSSARNWLLDDHSVIQLDLDII
jgi:putative transposase